MKSHFFVTGHISMKFRQKTSIGVLCRTLVEEFRKFFLKGDFILLQNRHFWMNLTGLRLTRLEVTGYVSRLR